MLTVSHPRVRRYEELTHGDIKQLDRKKTMVIATFSPLEVHGDHLPLGQDMFEAYMLAMHTAAACAEGNPDWTFLLLAPIPIACDSVPQVGSVSMPGWFVRDTAIRLLKPFALAGYGRLGYSSFHGGPRHFLGLEAAAKRLTRKFGVPTASLFSMVLKRVEEGNVFMEGLKKALSDDQIKIDVEGLKKDHHGGMVETSLALHLYPELVAPSWSEMPGSVPEAPRKGSNDSFLYSYEGEPSLVEMLQRNKGVLDSFKRAIRHFRYNGYYGYPALASAEQGKAMFEHLVELTNESVNEFIRIGAEMDVHSPLWKLRTIALSRPGNWIMDHLIMPMQRELHGEAGA